MLVFLYLYFLIFFIINIMAYIFLKDSLTRQKIISQIYFKFFYCILRTHLDFFAPPPFRAASMAYGGSRARGLIRAVAAGLCHGHSNAGSKPHLWPSAQLTATLDPSPTEQDQGLNLHPHECYSYLFRMLSHNRNSHTCISVLEDYHWIIDTTW